MPLETTFGQHFQAAVSAIDAGDVAALNRLLSAHPDLACERLGSAATWLRDQVGAALDGFFRDPYLLWFVAEDPVRNGRLPANIADLARVLIAAARAGCPQRVPEQAEYALRLVCWSWIARQSGVQIALIDVLLEAGATVDGVAAYEGSFGTHADSAIYNGNFGAAEHLVGRGARMTLTTALCLNRWADVEQIASRATLADRENAFVQAALNGNSEALRRMLALGMPATTVSGQNQSHGTALHHAVWSCSLEAVRVLVEAGADLQRRDTVHHGSPLDWAEYAVSGEKDPSRAAQYSEIATYLRGRG